MLDDAFSSDSDDRQYLKKTKYSLVGHGISRQNYGMHGIAPNFFSLSLNYTKKLNLYFAKKKKKT